MAFHEKKTTLRSIAKHLDTSICTVSRVLNGKGSQHRITETTQKRILDHAKKINYKPNVAAQSLRLNRMQEIGLILPDFSNPFFTHVAKYAAVEARKRNYSVQIIETEDNTETEIDAISQMLHRQLGGLIIWPVGIKSKHFSELPDNAPPIVLVDRCFPELELSQVALDNVGAAEMATLHLLDFGHREIACFQGLVHTATNDDRLKGYRRALAARGVDFDESLVIGDGFTQSSGYRAVGQLLASRPSTSAILSLSNQVTMGALRALAERDRQVPDDVSLVSFDEIDGVEFFATPLTVVSQPLTEIGLKAAELLFNDMDGVASSGERHQLLPASLISRSSVKQLAQCQPSARRG